MNKYCETMQFEGSLSSGKRRARLQNHGCTVCICITESCTYNSFGNLIIRTYDRLNVNYTHVWFIVHDMSGHEHMILLTYLCHTQHHPNAGKQNTVHGPWPVEGHDLRNQSTAVAFLSGFLRNSHSFLSVISRHMFYYVSHVSPSTR